MRELSGETIPKSELSWIFRGAPPKIETLEIVYPFAEGAVLLTHSFVPSGYHEVGIVP